jgi:hypothetical protein
MRKYLKSIGPAATPLSERHTHMPCIMQGDQLVFNDTTDFCECYAII